MKKIGMALSMAGAIGMATLAISVAQSAPGSASGQLSRAAEHLSPVQKTQFFIGDQEYCWYDHGWHGRGWYWCGYATREGSGWGGRSGWHHWDRHHPPLHGPGSSHNPRPGGNPQPIGAPVAPGGLPPTAGGGSGTHKPPKRHMYMTTKHGSPGSHPIKYAPTGSHPKK